MTRGRLMWWITLGGLAIVVAATAPGFPVSAEETTPAPAGQAPAADAKDGKTAKDAKAEEAEARATVEQILREQEQMLSGQFSYDPGTRRDPDRKSVV